MEEALEEKLFQEMRSKSKVELNPVQLDKLKYACKKSIMENPGLGFNDLVIACKIYLKFIIDFPELDLGPVIEKDKN